MWWLDGNGPLGKVYYGVGADPGAAEKLFAQTKPFLVSGDCKVLRGLWLDVFCVTLRGVFCECPGERFEKTKPIWADQVACHLFFADACFGHKIPLQLEK